MPKLRGEWRRLCSRSGLAVFGEHTQVEMLVAGFCRTIVSGRSGSWRRGRWQRCRRISRQQPLGCDHLRQRLEARHRAFFVSEEGQVNRAGSVVHGRDQVSPSAEAPRAARAVAPVCAAPERGPQARLHDAGMTGRSEPPSGVRRQPLLRGPVQDPEVPPRLPWPLPRHHRRDRLLPNVLPLVQHRTSPWRDRDAHPGRRAITIEPRACWSSAGGPFKPPGPVIPNASFEESHNRIPFPKPSGSTHL